MAPKRRTSTPSTATQSQRAQSTISFHKQGPNRITKPGAQRDAKSKKDASLLDTSRPNATDATLEQPTTADIAIAEQAASTIDELNSSGDGEISVEQPLEADSVTSKPIAPSAKPESAWDSPEGSKARKITDTQIKKYWLAKEQERKAPRVHQEGLTIREKLLREWDMSGQYGPCIGIARLKRWKRADMLGLNPPIEVLAVLLREVDKGNLSVHRAHVDELMSSRFIET